MSPLVGSLSGHILRLRRFNRLGALSITSMALADVGMAAQWSSSTALELAQAGNILAEAVSKMTKAHLKPRQIKVSPYVVYIDESFFNFWGLNNPDGNFCYVAFGIPHEKLSILDVEHKRLLDLFQTAVKSDLGETPPVEIKSVVFRRLELKHRRRIALLARGLMLRLGAFFLTEFCNVRGFILESLRSDLLEKGDSQIPEKWDSLYQAKREELSRTVKQQKLGQSLLLRKLIETPTASLAYFLAQRAEWYDLVVDPRGGVEDNHISKAILHTTEQVIRVVHRKNPNMLRATSFSTRSDNCPGLQMADLLAGRRTCR